MTASPTCYRTIRWPYEELFRAATRFAWELNERGVQKGDRVLLWAENSGWWVAAFLGCMLAGAVCVPMDLAADEGFAQRVASLAGIRLAVLGKDLAPPGSAPQVLQLENFFELGKNSREEVFPSPSIAGGGARRCAVPGAQQFGQTGAYRRKAVMAAVGQSEYEAL